MRRGHNPLVRNSSLAVTAFSSSTSSSTSSKAAFVFSSNIPTSIRTPTSLARVLSGLPRHPLLFLVVAPSLLLCRSAGASPIPLQKRDDSPGSIASTASADTRYLPAQIGGIVGSYALSLVIVAIGLLIVSKRRRERLSNGENEAEFLQKVDKPQVAAAVEQPPDPFYLAPPISPRSIPRSPVVLNIETSFAPAPVDPNPYIYPSSPTSASRSPLGVDQSVDQRIVTADRIMAQAQLEDMYKYVMEHDDAKSKGVEPPPIPALDEVNNKSALAPNQSGPSRPSTAGGPGPSILKKQRAKPAQLSLASNAPEDKRQSKASSIFSSLMSPRKKPKGLSISSPIMTPMSGTFPRESQEMNTIPPRQYAPPPPPPVPSDQLPYRTSKASSFVPITPDDSPVGTMSIDERLGRQPLEYNEGHSRNNSGAPTEGDPISASSEHSQAPLVGLPQSPKPGVNRFPTLPASPRSTRFPSNLSLPLSPKPGSSFSRPNAPSAVRTGGALPLRAYESSLASPTSSSIQTRQTTFERAGPLSPGDGRTPFTGAAMPYSPYQPFTPCVPVTPSLVTKADRKRMRRLEPKTPTLHMVRSADDIW